MGKKVTNSDWSDWADAFREHGYIWSKAGELANECEAWALNNAEMTWQDIFDAVLLADETDEFEF